MDRTSVRRVRRAIGALALSAVQRNERDQAIALAGVWCARLFDLNPEEWRDVVAKAGVLPPTLLGPLIKLSDALEKGPDAIADACVAVHVEVAGTVFRDSAPALVARAEADERRRQALDPTATSPREAARADTVEQARLAAMMLRIGARLVFALRELALDRHPALANDLQFHVGKIIEAPPWWVERTGPVLVAAEGALDGEGERDLAARDIVAEARSALVLLHLGFETRQEALLEGAVDDAAVTLVEVLAAVERWRAGASLAWSVDEAQLAVWDADRTALATEPLQQNLAMLRWNQFVTWAEGIRDLATAMRVDADALKTDLQGFHAQVAVWVERDPPEARPMALKVAGEAAEVVRKAAPRLGLDPEDAVARARAGTLIGRSTGPPVGRPEPLRADAPPSPPGLAPMGPPVPSGPPRERIARAGTAAWQYALAVVGVVALLVLVAWFAAS